jgi:chromosome segregation ATPase
MAASLDYLAYIRNLEESLKNQESYYKNELKLTTKAWSEEIDQLNQEHKAELTACKKDVKNLTNKIARLEKRIVEIQQEYQSLRSTGEKRKRVGEESKAEVVGYDWYN